MTIEHHSHAFIPSATQHPEWYPFQLTDAPTVTYSSAKRGYGTKKKKKKREKKKKWNAKKEEEEDSLLFFLFFRVLGHFWRRREEIKTHERLKKNSFSQDKTVQDFDKEAFFLSNERIFILYENPKETAL